MRETLGRDVGGSFIEGNPTYKYCTITSRFVNLPMGRNYMGHIGKDIATKLGLKDAGSYTGHCFRHIAATLAVDAGATTK